MTKGQERHEIARNVANRCCHYVNYDTPQVTIRSGFEQSFYRVEVLRGWRRYGRSNFKFAKATHEARVAPNQLVLQNWIEQLKERRRDVAGLALASRVKARDGSTTIHEVKVARRDGRGPHVRYQIVLVAVEEGVDVVGTGPTVEAACRDLRKAALVAIANQLPTA